MKIKSNQYQEILKEHVNQNLQEVLVMLEENILAINDPDALSDLNEVICNQIQVINNDLEKKARELLKVDDFVEFIYEDKKKVAQITQINKRNKNIAVTVLNPEIGESTNWGLPASYCKKINKEDLDSYKNHNIEGF